MSDKDKEKQAKAAQEAKPETIDETEVVEAEVVDVDPVDEADETEALKKQLAETQAALDKEKREYV